MIQNKRFKLRKRALGSFVTYLGQRPVRRGYILVGSYHHAVVEVQLSLEDLARATEHVAKVFNSSDGYLAEDSPCEDHTKANFEIGAQGQGAVTCYLNNDVNEGLTQYVCGGPDNGVDVTTRTGRKFKLQVKTFNWPFAVRGCKLPNDWMIENNDELEYAEGAFDYYVACERIEPDWIRILGTISPADFKRFCVDRSKQYGPGKLGLPCKSLCALRPIEDFVSDFAS
jgi:hypothetical protein